MGMQDAPKIGSLHLEPLLEELSHLRLANAEREQEMSCLKALHSLATRKELPPDEQLQLMVDLVPLGFLAQKEVHVQARIAEHAFSTPQFQSAQASYSTLIHCDEQEVGELFVQVTGQSRDVLPISPEKQRFLSLVAGRFGECIQVLSMRAEAETTKQRLTEIQPLRQELEKAHEQTRRLQDAMHEIPVPIVEIWDGVLFMPIGNVLNAERAWKWMEGACNGVFEKEAYFVIIDVGALDGAQDDIEWLTVESLFQVMRGVRFLGATAILTGVQPRVANKIISLNVNLASVLIHGSLRDGLYECIRRMKAIRRAERFWRKSSKVRK